MTNDTKYLMNIEPNEITLRPQPTEGILRTLGVDLKNYNTQCRSGGLDINAGTLPLTIQVDETGSVTYEVLGLTIDLLKPFEHKLGDEQYACIDGLLRN